MMKIVVLALSCWTLANAISSKGKDGVGVQADWYEASNKVTELWWVVYKAQDSLKTIAGFSNSDIGSIVTEKVNQLRNAALDPISNLQGLVLMELLTSLILDENIVEMVEGVRLIQKEINPYVIQLPQDGQSEIAYLYNITFTDISRVHIEINKLIQ